ncbi:MAG TPA: hypothetical protein PK156_05060 [Polyangium sp.]|nr:hypothetical protein [Polyangium sp.]
MTAFGAFGPTAAASEPDDEPPWLMSLGPVDLEPQHDLWVDGASTGSLWISVQATLVRTDDGRHDFAAMALLGVPLERLGQTRDRRIAERLAPLPTLTEGSSTAPAADAAKTAGPVVPEPLVTPGMARAAIAAALEHAGLEQSTSRVDRLAARARTSAVLPELRLRVTRQLDDSQVLSPTEYDPDRVTATVKASWWFEARATFKLDKLVFADEEVALERMREDRLEAAKKLRERVLETLFAWQRALRTRDEPTVEPDAQMKAALAAIEAEVTLDVLTGGWFTRWKVARARPGPT